MVVGFEIEWAYGYHVFGVVGGISSSSTEVGLRRKAMTKEYGKAKGDEVII